MRKVTRGVLVGVATALVGTLLLATPWGTEFEQGLGLKMLFRLRGPLPTPDEVAVAAIDDQTGASSVSVFLDAIEGESGAWVCSATP